MVTDIQAIEVAELEVDMSVVLVSMMAALDFFGGNGRPNESIRTFRFILLILHEGMSIRQSSQVIKIAEGTMNV